MSDLYLINNPYLSFEPVERSEWRCYLFGGSEDSGIVWNPIKGREPNWFRRLMMRLFFGCQWVRVKQ